MQLLECLVMIRHLGATNDSLEGGRVITKRGGPIGEYCRGCYKWSVESLYLAI